MAQGSHADGSDDRYRLIAENASDIVFRGSPRGVLEWVSDSVVQVLGFTPDELIGHPISDLLLADDVPAMRGALERTAAGERATYRARFLCRDGSTRWLEITARPVFAADGSLAARIGSARDVQAQVEAEIALAASEERFRRVLTDSAIGMCLLGPDGRFLEVNDELCTLLGRSADDLGARRWQELTHPDDLAACSAVVDRIVAGDLDRARVTKRYLRPDGTTVRVDVAMSAVRDAEGDLVHVITQIIDQTDRIAAEEALAASEAMFRAAFEENPEIIGVYRPIFDVAGEFVDSELIYVNRAARERILGGLPLEDVIGSRLFVRWPHLRSIGFDDWARAAASGRSVRTEMHSVLASGERWSDVYLFPFPGGFVHISRDITDAKRAEIAAVRARAELAEAQRLAHVGSWTFEPVADRVTWSDELFRIMGLAPGPDAPSFASQERFFTPAGWERLGAAVAHATTSGEPYEVAVEVVRPDGEVRFAIARGEAVRGADGSVSSLRGTVTDVTAAELARRELAERTADLEAARDVAGLGIWRRDLVTGRTTKSPQLLRLFGLDPDGPPPSPVEIDARLTPESLALRDAAVQTSVATGEPWEIEIEIRRPDGTSSWGLQRGVAEVASDGTVTGYHGTVIDITDRKRAEEVRRASEELYRGLIETIDEGALVQRSDGAIIASNRRAGEILGLAPGADLSLATYSRFWEAYRPDGSPLLPADHPATVALRTGRPSRGDVLAIVGGRDRRTWLSVNAEPLTDAGGDVTAVLVTFADITERRAVDAALAGEAERHRHFVEVGAEGVLRITEDGTILEANPAFAQIIGAPEADLVGRQIQAFFAREDERPRRLPGASEGEALAGDRLLLRPDGGRIHVEWRASRLADGTILTSVRDVSRERDLESRLERSQRLETMGRLAGGVAHDFNNILTAISGTAELLADAVPADDPRRQDVDAIRDAGGRAADLTRRLLTLGRPESVAAPVDLDFALGEIASMLQRTLGAGITLRFDLADGPDPVAIDRSQLDQVVVNLAVNARDAMPGGGVIAIATGHVAPTPEVLAAHPEAAERSFARLSVSDTGSGIPPDVLPRIFDAFYTTKESGKGTGLGLATVHEIVTAAGGWIDVETTPGRGTTFAVALPLASGRDAAATADDEAIPGGTETILLVEDDNAARQVAARHLGRLGYRVVDVADPFEALRLADAPGFAVDLIISDVSLPGMPGPSLVDRLVERLPGARVLFMSGTAPDAALTRRLEDPAVAFLAKPFDRRRLASSVRAALDSRPDDAGGDGLA